MSHFDKIYMGRHFELDENFNFLEEGEDVLNEKIAASELNPNNIFIMPLERSPPTSQATQSGSISITTSHTSTINTKRPRTSIV